MTRTATLVALILAAGTVAVYADYVLRDSTGNTYTISTATIGGKLVPYSLPVDTNGNPIVVASSAQASAILAAIQLPIPTSAPVDCSGTITVGGTAQQLITALGAPHGFQLQNLASETLGYSWVTTTPAVNTNGTYNLTAGSLHTTPLGLGITTAVYIIGATTGDKFTCSRW